MDGQELETFVRRKLGEARQLAGYNKREMAKVMGVAPSTWLAWEAGDRDLNVGLVAEVAKATGRALSFFFPPEMGAIDLGGTLLRLFPGMDAGTVRSLERTAAALYEEDLRRKQNSGR